MPHNTEHPVPDPPAEIIPFHSESEASTDEGKSSASEFEDCADERASINLDTNCHCFSQGDLQDLSRDLNLSKEKSELLKSRLKQWNYEPSEWRLFIDSNKTSLKAVLLHNGNKNFSTYCL